MERPQATLDFVDVDVDRDMRVFISPRALNLMQTGWGDACVSLMQSFFGTVIEHIKNGRDGSAETLLTELREPNETHLGMSKSESRGRALGNQSAHAVWSALSRSAAARSGLIRDLEDTVLLIHGISVDIVSDITTNIIRGPLIKYTQEQCKQLAIPLEQGVPSGPIWDPFRSQWINEFVELPVVEGTKLLLVPKAIVRRTPLYNMQEYYRHYMLPHMQNEELKAGSALVSMLKTGPKVHKTDLIAEYGGDKEAIIRQTLKYPSILDWYRSEKEKCPFHPLNHEDLEEINHADPVDWDKLLNAAVLLPTGNLDAAAYEKAIEALLTALFYPDLVSPVYQDRIHDGRKRIDIKYTNMGDAGFFLWLAKHYTSPHVFVECKNYSGNVANPELDQLAGRFGRSRGEVGFLVCRQFDNKARFQKSCRDTAQDGRGFIIPLDDEDLMEIVEFRKTHTGHEYREFKLPVLFSRLNRTGRPVRGMMTGCAVV